MKKLIKMIYKPVLILIPFVLGLVGFTADGLSIPQAVYACICLYGMGHKELPANLFIEIARWLAPLATAAWVVGGVALAIVAVFALVNHLRGRWTYGDDESWDTNEQQNEDGE